MGTNSEDKLEMQTPDEDSMDMEMEAPAQKKKKNVKPVVLVLVLLLLCGLGGGGYYYMTQMNNDPVVSAPITPKKATAKKNAKQADKQDKKGKAEVGKEAKSEVKISLVPEFGDIAEWNRLNSQIETLEKKKKLMVLENDLLKIERDREAIENKGKEESREESLSPEQVRAMIGMELMRHQAAVEAANAQKNAIKEEQEEKDNKRQIGLIVLSVQGKGKDVTATVTTDEGEVKKIKVGDKTSRGVVTSITRKGVTVKENGKDKLYPFN